MDNLGDLLYIVLLAIVGLVSLFNAGRKKKTDGEAGKRRTPPDVVTPQTASDRDFWDILTESEEIPPVVIKPQIRKSIPKPQTVTTVQPSPFLKGESEIERAIRQQTPDTVFAEEEERPPLVSAGEFNDPEALRKAVVYTEILNRKF